MKIKTLTLITLIICTFSNLSNATLVNRGRGLIYDDVLDVTWLQDSNIAASNNFGVIGVSQLPISPGTMSRSVADQFITAMNTANYLGINNWRLPHLFPVNGVDLNTQLSFDGSTDNTHNITTTNSELGYLHYVTLGNPGRFSPDGSSTPCQGANLCIDNTGPFTNLDTRSPGWWADAIGPNRNDIFWNFSPKLGAQSSLNSFNNQRVWAVRDGDISAVPLPSAVWLLMSSLIGLIGFSRKRSV